MYSVIINNGQYTFGETTRWYTHDRAEILDNNATAFYEQLLQIEGELVGTGSDPATDVQAQFRTLKNVLFLPNPVKVEIKNLETSVIEVTYDPALYIGTPKMRELVQIPTDGADQASHIKYHASFYIRKPSGGGQSKDTAGFTREVEEFSLDGNVYKKIWRASATKKTLAEALALVLSFKPTGVSNLDQDLEQDLDTMTARATWTWEKTSQQDAYTFNCEVEIVKSGHGWNESPVVGTGQVPNFHRNRYRAGTITVRYAAQASALGILLNPPAPHFSEGNGLFRDDTKAPPSLSPVLDPVSGVWRVVYTEFWYFTSKEAPFPKHTGHASAFPKTAPISGRMGK